MTSHASDDRITEEAADWLVELKGSGSACHAEFFEWLRRSPEHVREFLAVTGLARKLGGVDPHRQIDIRELLGESGADIVHLQPQTPARDTARPQRGRKLWVSGMAAGLAALAAAAALWFALGPDTYATKVGEQRSFVLSDGSLIYLNTASKARVHFSASVREVELIAGEALFTAERDANRPFQVKAGATTVRAVGTQFNVYRHGDADTTVSVLEGAVVAGSTRLDAGEQANIRPSGAVAKQAVADIGNAVAWRQRQLVFRKTPLLDVVAEFNRYNQRQIQVDEPVARERQITGVFAADRPESFVLFLRKDVEISVTRNAGGWRIENLTDTP